MFTCHRLGTSFGRSSWDVTTVRQVGSYVDTGNRGSQGRLKVTEKPSRVAVFIKLFFTFATPNLAALQCSSSLDVGSCRRESVQPNLSGKVQALRRKVHVRVQLPRFSIDQAHLGMLLPG